MTVLVIAHWAQGEGLSGGDRIFIELFKRWIAKHGIDARFFISEEALKMIQRYGLPIRDFKIWSRASFGRFGIFMNGITRTLKGLWEALFIPIPSGGDCYVYSASDFLPDSLPAFIIKMRNKSIKWIAGFYLFAPNPFSSESPYRGIGRLRNLIYFMSQKPVHWLVNNFADFIFVTSAPDVERFITRRHGAKNIIVIKGGVDFTAINEYAKSSQLLPVSERRYDTCFIGRLHPQKGVLELIDIWDEVVKRRPGPTRLAIIGDGPLKESVRKRIQEKGLLDCISLEGFKEGPDKFNIFQHSKIVAHPAIYDSGGMASMEAMAWGLPAVSFDLEALKTYYPKGMLKVECFNKSQFACAIIELLSNKELYEKTSKEAVSLAKEWDWDRRADEVIWQIRMQG